MLFKFFKIFFIWHNTEIEINNTTFIMINFKFILLFYLFLNSILLIILKLRLIYLIRIILRRIVSLWVLILIRILIINFLHLCILLYILILLKLLVTSIRIDMLPIIIIIGNVLVTRLIMIIIRLRFKY